MSIHQESLDKIKNLFYSTPDLKIIEMRVDKALLVGYGPLVSIGVKSINGEVLHNLTNIHDGGIYLHETSDLYQSFLVATNLKSHEVKLLASTLQKMNRAFFMSYEILKREDFIKENI